MSYRGNVHLGVVLGMPRCHTLQDAAPAFEQLCVMLFLALLRASLGWCCVLCSVFVPGFIPLQEDLLVTAGHGSVSSYTWA